MSSSRLISGAGAACVPWQAPEMEHPSARTAIRRDDDVALEAVRQRAWEQGFGQGRSAGLEAGRAELAARSATLGRVLDALARPLEDLDHRVEAELLALVKVLTRQLVRREMNLEPTHIVGVLREGLAALPVSAGDVVVRLHPDDAATVRECLRAATGSDGAAADAGSSGQPDSIDTRDGAWHIEPDPLVERGGCLIDAARSTVDARLDTRLARAMSTLLEDERDVAG